MVDKVDKAPGTDLSLYAATRGAPVVPTRRQGFIPIGQADAPDTKQRFVTTADPSPDSSRRTVVITTGQNTSQNSDESPRGGAAEGSQAGEKITFPTIETDIPANSEKGVDLAKPQSPETQVSVDHKDRTVQRREYDKDGIRMIALSGDIVGSDEANEVMARELDELGIIDELGSFLVRQVRATVAEDAFANGCERNENSIRDPVLEEDFGFGPNDYTYLHASDDRRRFLQVTTYMFHGGGRTVTTIYKADAMQSHLETKYDLGQRAIYSFKDRGAKRDAIYAGITYEGIFARDEYDYGDKLEGRGRHEEAIEAYERFVDSPPDWALGDASWVDEANRRIAELRDGLAHTER